MLVAAAMARPPRHRGGVDAGARLARQCLKGCGDAGARLLRWIDSRIGRAALAVAELIALPGIAAHYHWRKRHIADWTQAELDAGASQLVVLGAGFDGLALGLRRRYPELSVFEIDRACSIEIKRAALRQVGYEAERHSLLACDFGQTNLAEVLRSDSCFDPAARTVIVAEGLLMYLTREQVAALCRDLAAALESPAVLVFTLMQLDCDGVPAFRRQSRLVRGWLARRGEPFRWGSGPERLRDDLHAFGIREIQIADATDSNDADPCPGEWVLRGILQRC